MVILWLTLHGHLLNTDYHSILNVNLTENHIESSSNDWEHIVREGSSVRGDLNQLTLSLLVRSMQGAIM